MHDLNDALDELRHVIPYAHSPSVRKLSKIATLLLAKNYILMQSNALNELRRALVCLHQHSTHQPGAALPQSLAASVAALLGGAQAALAGQQHGQTPGGVKHDSWSPGGATVERQQQSNSADLATKQAQQADGQHQLQHQVAPSVQNRRRKYNMLISRILSDVASNQQLAGPFVAPPTFQQQAPPPPMGNPPRPAAFRGLDEQRQQEPAGGERARTDERRRRDGLYPEQAAREQQRPGLELVGRCGGGQRGHDEAAMRRSADSEGDDDASVCSGRSSPSGCQSLVSVGSPQHCANNGERPPSTTSTVVTCHLARLDERQLSEISERGRRRAAG